MYWYMYLCVSETVECISQLVQMLLVTLPQNGTADVIVLAILQSCVRLVQQVLHHIDVFLSLHG